MIKQISIFLQNEPGTLERVTKSLADAGIDIRALTVADTADFGLLRLIVTDPAKAVDVLKNAGVSAVEHDVLGVRVEDQPGGLHKVAESLSADDVNIEYVYAFVTKSHDQATVVLRTDDLGRAQEILAKKGFSIVEEGELASI